MVLSAPVRTVFSLVVSSAIFSNTWAATDTRPNILVIIADDLGIGDLSCYGNTSFPTRHIDRLAAGGVRLTHHVSAASVCTPSRTALLTGRYPVRSGMQEAVHGPIVPRYVFSSAGLPNSEVTFAKALKDAGYRTKLVGKWHQGWSCERWSDECHGPRSHGFDSFFGLPYTLQEEEEDQPLRAQRSNPFKEDVVSELYNGCAREAGYECSGVKMWKLWLKMIHSRFHDSEGVLHADWWGVTASLDKFFNHLLVRDTSIESWPYQLPGLAQRLLEESRDFIVSSSPSSDPFLLVHSLLHPHTPLFTAPSFINVSNHSRYADNVMEMDWVVGQLLAALETVGVADNTLVHFVSDQGAQLELVGPDGQKEGGSNGVFRGGKGQGGMEGGIRVPALFRWPAGGLTAGREVHVPTSSMDLLPTLLHAAGVRPPSQTLDGQNILPLLQGTQEKTSHRFMFHYCGSDIHAMRYAPDDDAEAVYKLYFKLPNYPDPQVNHCGVPDGICLCSDTTEVATPLLYDVTSDPSEVMPISEEEDRYQEYVPVMLKALAEHRLAVRPERSQCERFWDVMPRPHLVPWDQLARFRGVDYDMHGLDEWTEFIDGSCSDKDGKCS